VPPASQRRAQHHVERAEDHHHTSASRNQGTVNFGTLSIKSSAAGFVQRHWCTSVSSQAAVTNSSASCMVSGTATFTGAFTNDRALTLSARASLSLLGGGGGACTVNLLPGTTVVLAAGVFDLQVTGVRASRSTPPRR
jgi:hypothetical protein